jgi:hypothetical protein
MNGTSQQIDYVFPTDTICFDIFSDDADVTDSLTLTWNQVIPAATFTTTTGLHPTGNFCWTPTVNDVRSQPYMFTATIRDNYCPVNRAGVYSYFIYVTYDSSLVLSNASDLLEYSSLSVHPNPSSGIFTVQSEEKFSCLTVFNALGACILKNDEPLIDISGHPAGIYFVEIQTADGKIQRQKLVKE